MNTKKQKPKAKAGNKKKAPPMPRAAKPVRPLAPLGRREINDARDDERAWMDF
jgi:hypothetical protein